MELSRIVASMNRAGEYFSSRELQAMTGQPEDNFQAVVIKELLDNAIDAAEQSNKSPVIDIVLATDGHHTRCMIQDNGPGMDAGTVKKVLDFERRVSSNLLYRAPTRGAQGNALKTVLGIPFALMGVDAAPVILESRNLRHSIKAGLRGDLVSVEHAETPIEHEAGTRIIVTLPGDKLMRDAYYWARRFWGFNPHLSVKIAEKQTPIELPQFSATTPEKAVSYEIYQCTNPDLKKFMPTDLTAPHWYSRNDLLSLIGHTLQNCNGSKPPTLREFARQFKGITASSKVKAVCDALPGVTLPGLLDEPDWVDQLMTIMQTTATVPQPGILGCIGKEHFREVFTVNKYKPETFLYKKGELLLGGIPYVIEAATALADEPAIYMGLNFSPTYGDPLGDHFLQQDTIFGKGLWGFWRAAGCEFYESDVKHVVAFHLVSPCLEFQDRGKTRLNMPDDLIKPVTDVLWAVTKKIYADKKRRERDATRQEYREQQTTPQAGRTTIRDAVFEHLQTAFDKTTGGGKYPGYARDVFYQIRPMVEQDCGRELTFSYFGDLSVEYQQQHGPLSGYVYDARGTFHEPHTRHRIATGTIAMQSYIFPEFLYDKILYIEKEGRWDILEVAKIPERYDLAVFAGKGYATEATRRLFQRADASRGYTLFVLHDADPDGYNIARTLREETARMPGYQVDVIDLGLFVADASEMGLVAESYTRKTDIPQTLELSSSEVEFFQGKKDGKHWKNAKRVELNAMTAPQLVEYVERKLALHGAARKLIPPATHIKAEMETLYASLIREALKDRLLSLIDLDALVDEAAQQMSEPSHNPETIAALLVELIPESWRHLVQEDVLRSVQTGMQNFDPRAVAQRIQENLNTVFNHEKETQDANK